MPDNLTVGEYAVLLAPEEFVAVLPYPDYLRILTKLEKKGYISENTMALLLLSAQAMHT